ncbi:hypothetical protein Tco_0750169 [Tanacetum coccineum]|uniref:Integrase, catalytic region, zinc finger, CCHC-type, peptidase aspartic, catalytic n=1 Tax=Tanacetum coccineum TaxID=301880 RepID=A0ABQ4Z3P9_9ASTR
MKSIKEGPFQMGTVSDVITGGNEGAIQTRSSTCRVLTDLSVKKRKGIKTDIRATNIYFREYTKGHLSLIQSYLTPKDIWEKVDDDSGRHIASVNVQGLALQIQNTSSQMLLMQAQESGAVLDEATVLVSCRGKTWLHNVVMMWFDSPENDLEPMSKRLPLKQEGQSLEQYKKTTIRLLRWRIRRNVEYIGYQWRPTGKKLTLGKLDCGSQWRPTGKKFALGEICQLTKLSVKCRTGHALNSGMNDHFGVYMVMEINVMGDSVISRVYYVEGLGHNLFSVGQFCDSDLEVAFRKHTCFVRDSKGTYILKGSRGTNLYTISIDEMMKSSPICLLSKLKRPNHGCGHRRFKHLNFGTINESCSKRSS